MSDLDAQLKAELRVEVQRLHQELDATMVYVTHDQTEAMTMSDHVVLLNNGQLEQFAPPGELFDRPVSKYVSRFIGTPSTNLLPTTVVEHDGSYVLDGDGFEIPAPADHFANHIGESITLGIRPQYLSPDGGEHQFTVIVDVVEQLGTEFVVHGQSTAGDNVDVVSSTLGHVSHGDEIVVGFDEDDLFVFDDNGQTICYGDELTNHSPKQQR